MYKLPPKHLHFVSPQDPCSKFPPSKKQGVYFSNSKTPRQIIHQMDALLSQASATVWSLGGVVLMMLPHLVEHFITPKNRRDWCFFLATQSWWWFFFVKGNGRFRAISGKSRLLKMMIPCRRWFFSNGSPEKVTEAKRFVELGNQTHLLKVPFVELGECFFFALQICPG